MAKKTAPASDVASFTSIDSISKQKKKSELNQLMQVRKESRVLAFAKKTCCSTGFLAASFLIIFALIIAAVVWSSTFASGYISTMSAIDSVKELVRLRAVETLQDKLSEPAEMIKRQESALNSYPANFTFDDPGRLGLQRNMLNTMVEYKDTLGVGIYYGVRDDSFSWLTFNNDEMTELSASYTTNGTRRRIIYDLQLNQIGPMTNGTSSYRPTQRPWYGQSVQKRAVGISDPYIFVGTYEGLPGVTYTLPWINNNGDVQLVFALDYVLSDLSTLLRGVQVGKSGSSFLVERNGFLLASSKNISFSTTNGNTVERVKAVNSQSASQRTAAQIIEEQVGFAHVKSGFTVDYSGNVLEVVELNPTLRTTNQRLLSKEWVLVFIYPIFEDYTQIILWANLASVAISLMLVLFACTIAVALVLLLFVLPLNLLVRDMQVIQSMELEKIRKRPAVPIYEISEFQKNFYRTLDFLKLYKSFLPSYLVNDADEMTEATQSIHGSESISDTTSKRSGSIISQRTGLFSSTKSGIQSRAMQKLRRFEIGLEHGDGVALVVRLLHANQLCNMNQEEFIDQHSRIVSLVQKAFKVHGGLLDRFTEEELVGSFFDMRKAVAAAANLRQKLLSLIGQFKLQYTHQLDFCIGISHGDIAIGVLGSDNLRSKRVFGQCVHSARALASLGDKWPCKLLIDHESMKRLQKKKWVYRQVCNDTTIPGSLAFEIVGHNSVQSNEWNYEREASNKLEAFAVYRKAFESMEKEKFDKAAELFQSFLEVVEGDALATMHLKQLKQLKQE